MLKALPSVCQAVLPRLFDNCDTEEDLQEFHTEMIDWFQPIPNCVEDPFSYHRAAVSWQEMGVRKMSLKADETLRCYFINRPDSPHFESDIFKNTLDFAATQ